MEKTGTVKKGENCLVIVLGGDQTYVKIFDAGGALVRHDLSQGATELLQIGLPGKYKVETDGAIVELRSRQFELKTGEDVN
jgi:hypothetical protein